MSLIRLALLSLLLVLSACSSEQNDPYPKSERGQNILYSAFTDRPKHLDPVQSYTEDEITFTAQIYEPPLQYHYLKRPYTLIPATSAAVPLPRYYDAQGRELPADAPAAKIATGSRIQRRWPRSFMGSIPRALEALAGEG